MSKLHSAGFGERHEYTDQDPQDMLDKLRDLDVGSIMCPGCRAFHEDLVNALVNDVKLGTIPIEIIVRSVLQATRAVNLMGERIEALNLRLQVAEIQQKAVMAFIEQTVGERVFHLAHITLGPDGEPDWSKLPDDLPEEAKQRLKAEWEVHKRTNRKH